MNRLKIKKRQLSNYCIPLVYISVTLVVGMALVRVEHVFFPDLVSTISADQHGVATLAHLGGFMAGYLFLKLRTGSSGAATPVQRIVPTKVLVHPAARRQPASPPPPPEPQRHEGQREQIDRVLEKISREGESSLSAEERRLLLEESERLRKKE